LGTCILFAKNLASTLVNDNNKTTTLAALAILQTLFFAAMAARQRRSVTHPVRYDFDHTSFAVLGGRPTVIENASFFPALAVQQCPANFHQIPNSQFQPLQPTSTLASESVPAATLSASTRRRMRRRARRKQAILDQQGRIVSNVLSDEEEDFLDSSSVPDCTQPAANSPSFLVGDADGSPTQAPSMHRGLSCTDLLFEHGQPQSPGITASPTISTGTVKRASLSPEHWPNHFADTLHLALAFHEQYKSAESRSPSSLSLNLTASASSQAQPQRQYSNSPSLLSISASYSSVA
jgi:hypothetical protein